MKLNTQTLQIALISNFISVLLKGIAIALRLSHVELPKYVAITLSVTSYISHILVLLYLIALLRYQKAKHTFIGFIILFLTNILFLLLDIVFAAVPDLTWNYIGISTAIGSVIMIDNIYMLITSSKIQPAKLKKAFRYFFITMLSIAIIRAALPPIVVLLFHRTAIQYLSYTAILSLLPTIALFFIIKQAATITRDKDAANSYP